MIYITIILISGTKYGCLAKERNRPDFSYNDETAETRNESHECNSKKLKTIIALVYIITQDITQSIKILGVTGEELCSRVTPLITS